MTFSAFFVGPRRGRLVWSFAAPMPSFRAFFSRQPVLLALWAAVLFALCFGLYRRHHDFPYYYHPDEPGKVDQVLSGKWNFHHPMLLLATARAAVQLGRRAATEQAVVETGRSVSAGFMALAVVALSLTAYLWRGWIPAVIAGAALGLDHQFYELAHYMKEDSALMAGLALAFLAALFYAQAPSTRRAALLGAGCALAIAGKYLGRGLAGGRAAFALAGAARAAAAARRGLSARRWCSFSPR